MRTALAGSGWPEFAESPTSGTASTRDSPSDRGELLERGSSGRTSAVNPKNGSRIRLLLASRDKGRVWVLAVALASLLESQTSPGCLMLGAHPYTWWVSTARSVPGTSFGCCAAYIPASSATGQESPFHTDLKAGATKASPNSETDDF